MDEKERIEELRRLLHEYNIRYYIYNDPIITDLEFDSLMNELQKLEQRHPELYDANSPTQRVGSDLNGNFEQVEHKYPMLSLSNTYNEQDVAAWYDSVCRGLDGEKFDVCCEIKFDGLSISLIYIDGKLIRVTVYMVMMLQRMSVRYVVFRLYYNQEITRENLRYVVRFLCHGMYLII